MNLVMGGFFEGFYWESGVLESIAKKENALNLYTSSLGSLRGLFYALYGVNFFGRLKDFIYEKNNPLREVITNTELYNSRYAQTTALIRLGRGKMSLYNPDNLKKFLEGYFGNQTLSSLRKNVSFEVFELKNKEVIILKNETKIVDMLMMELAFPPYYSYYEYQGGFFIPTSYLSFIPQKFPKDAVIISFDPALTYPDPKNTVEILLKTSYSRTLKNYRLLTEDFSTIEPQKQLKDYFNMSAFFDGQNHANNFLEAKV
ncbi:Patatin [Petrotoga mobilis SJ95]|uniref:Patatin n=1 Tax=Petrotoga mobilis (strain DSM 10674 / SJ95) TaxID=403833 RepID=A9BEP0_PETMO|nr:MULTISPECIES: patatin-like phospholipase family protein [Petrotoga]ABX30768.1 Patatin [Petrotoga mobilis SJ95]MBL5981308.1 hypothetical protein [Petrotoga sp. 8T1HF07.NaAc.6.1]PNR89329.1 hypothetical protein X925_03530 [Petrotoga sp. 9T1HF07.CasAA.8.2]RLL83232.1 hypothetical protein BZ25_07105 [Petrotoga sp. Shatin.DS.tank11.9.2.9.3]RLL90577.1 hypothetical protein CN13_00170 [Petrotoga sp. HKA.pet.4.5]